MEAGRVRAKGRGCGFRDGDPTIPGIQQQVVRQRIEAFYDSLHFADRPGALPRPERFLSAHSDDGAQIQVGKAQAATGGWTNVQYRGTGFATVPVTITTIQTFHGQSCYNDQSGMDNRNDRQQCTSEQWTCPPGANGAQNPACQNVGQRDGAGDGYGPGKGKGNN